MNYRVVFDKAKSSTYNGFMLLFLLVLISSFILFPFHNFQEFLSQGDHGRDLYAGQAILRGEMPYKDFWWVYGPLMPYLFAAFYKIFGAHVTTLILAKFTLKVLGGVFLYLALSTFFTRAISFAAAIWFVIFHQDFFFTYNHIGGITAGLAFVWLIFRYFKNPQASSALLSLIPIFILCLIKINFGIIALFTAIVSVFLYDWAMKVPFSSLKKAFYACAFLTLPAIVAVIYASFLGGLSAMEIRQCLPYLGDDQPYNVSPWLALKSFIVIISNNIKSNWMNITFAVILIGSILRTIYLWIKGRLNLIPIFIIGLLCVLYALNFHEYLKSGVWYRAYWSQPLSIMLCFVFFDLATKSIHPFFRKFVITFIVLMAAISWQGNVTKLGIFKTPAQALNADGKPVYLTNQNTWIQTVEETTKYLKDTLNSDELFFALPYDCLYYYLTNKKSPTRQLIFFDHIKIPRDQEERTIYELEKNKVNYIVLSSRSIARQEPGLGIFGQTYCPLIAGYIKANFEPIKQIGDWTNEPGWAWNHGTVILKRKGQL